MFGNRKKISQEDYERELESCARGREIIEQLLDKRNDLADDFMEVGKSRVQMDSDISHLAENIESMAENARLNTDDLAKLKHDMEEYRNEMDNGEQAGHKLWEAFDQQVAEVSRLVEENKHFTSPSKRLGEAPTELRSQRKSYMSQLQIMGEYGKQMGVLALNAAIEAGRMGESGRDFVLAADNVRSFSVQYENATQKLYGDIKDSEDYIAALEETIHSLVGMLKDSNLAVSKLMRGLQEISQQREKAPIRNFSEDIVRLQEQTLKLRETEEEIVKTGERNRMEIEDIRSEVNTQVKHLKEIDDQLKIFFQSAGDYCKEQ